MNRELARAVRVRAAERCEYCLLPQSALPLPFQIDHIIAAQHGGKSIAENLASACPHCSRYKGPNIAGRDTESGDTVSLFDPRKNIWQEHFELQGPYIVGLTPSGRATVRALAMNAEDLLAFRNELLEEGLMFT